MFFFCQSRHFVSVCECVSACLPPAVECSKTVCGPVLDSSQLSKKICLWLQGKGGVRTGTCVCGMDGPNISFKNLLFFQRDSFYSLSIYKKQGTTLMGGAWGVRGRGCPFSSPFPLIRIPALRAKVCCESHEWRRQFCC